MFEELALFLEEVEGDLVVDGGGDFFEFEIINPHISYIFHKKEKW